ncbi:hypothetical protein J5N97_030312 [Dioscorea zingiberensis]|uniref:non-specific serine/threonine protein kinase n=1 Tax=Dioscorea zingiberensis TaxID=325984 RepID=A0A9D5BXJ8_9LILI|nr:hypothetical protein J5N97_030312 [Dioscorea zingiberensis]
MVLSQQADFIYNGFTGANSNISLNGVSEIQHDGILRLTNETLRLIGRAFYPTPLLFKNSTDGSAFSFSTAFAFSVVPEYPKLGGHGLAFVLATSMSLPGALPSQYLGLLNATDNGNATNHVFAVEFDTVQDFEFGDINDNHVGIDINSMTSNQSQPVAYFDDDSTKRDLNLKTGDTLQAWIDYDAVSKVLNVTISPFSTKPTIPIISFPVDLSPILHDRMFVGFSASTGLLASSHYLFGWSFKMNGVATSLDLSSLPSLPKPPKKNTTFVIAISISSVVFLIAAISAAAYLFFKIKNADLIEALGAGVRPPTVLLQRAEARHQRFPGPSELLGFGGLCKFYKGTFRGSKTEVAVKRVSHESRQGFASSLRRSPASDGSVTGISSSSKVGAGAGLTSYSSTTTCRTAASTSTSSPTTNPSIHQSLCFHGGRGSMFSKESRRLSYTSMKSGNTSSSTGMLRRAMCSSTGI